MSDEIAQSNVDARNNRHFLNIYFEQYICWTRNIVYTNKQQLCLMWIAHQSDFLHKWYTKHDPWRCKCALRAQTNHSKVSIYYDDSFHDTYCRKSVSHLVCAFNFYFVCKVYTVYRNRIRYTGQGHIRYWWNVGLCTKISTLLRVKTIYSWCLRFWHSYPKINDKSVRYFYRLSFEILIWIISFLFPLNSKFDLIYFANDSKDNYVSNVELEETLFNSTHIWINVHHLVLVVAYVWVCTPPPTQMMHFHSVQILNQIV